MGLLWIDTDWIYLSAYFFIVFCCKKLKRGPKATLLSFLTKLDGAVDVVIMMARVKAIHILIAEPHTQIGKKRKPRPWVDFFMVIIANGIARGRVRTTMKLPNMVAILHWIIGWQIHGASVYPVLLWYWTSMLWSIVTCQNKVSADHYHVTTLWAQVYSSSRSRVFFKLTADQLLVFDWNVGSCQVNLLKTEQDCLEVMVIVKVIP